MTKYRSVYRATLLSGFVIWATVAGAALSASIQYHVTDLGVLGGVESAGGAINASGQVTGYSTVTGSVYQHGFLWTPTVPNGTNGVMIDMGTIAGDYSYGWDINSRGQVAGHSEGYAVLWTPIMPNGTTGSMVKLGQPEDRFVNAFGINDSGQVAGIAYPLAATSVDAFLWTPNAPNDTSGTLHDLGTVGGTYSVGYDINSGGQVVGESGTASGFIRAFLWSPSTPNGASGSMTDLGTLGGNNYSGARAISNDGRIVGESNILGDTAGHAFLYDGTMHDLGTLGGNSSAAVGINASGQVVGYSQMPGNRIEHAFLWGSDGGMLDLNSLIKTSLGWDLKIARAINDAGQITGTGHINGEDHAFLLTPISVPEPASVVLLALGAVAMTFRRGRRIPAPWYAAAVMLIATTAHAASYTITDLGVAGAENTLGWGINAGGQVTGYASSTVEGDDTVTAFVWKPDTPNSPTGTMHDLGSIGGNFSWGIGINAAGQVSGVSATADDAAEHASLWIPSTPNSTTGTMHDLGTLGGTYSQGTGINNSGQLTGYSGLTDDVASHAMMWKPSTFGSASGTMYDLGTLGGTYSFAWDINTSGHVVGESDLAGDAIKHAFLWKPTSPNGATGAMHDLGTLGGTTSFSGGINDQAQVVGTSMTIGDDAVHAFLWSPSVPGGVTGTMMDLGTLGGNDSYGYTVSNNGSVIGASAVPPEVSNYYHAFLYTTAGGMVDLNTLIDPLSGWELHDADDINDAGQITGQGLINGEYHAFLLTPVAAFDGDFNHDNTVDAADYVMWRKTDGTAAGFELWHSHFGQSSGSGAVRYPLRASAVPPNAAIPEPSSFAVIIVAIAWQWPAGFPFQWPRPRRNRPSCP